jgi:hypothetical protein
MYMVYWTEAGQPRARCFERHGLADALAQAEQLRRRQHQGEPVAFVTIAAEDPAQVGRAGVADPPADYAWVKRRPPPRRKP